MTGGALEPPRPRTVATAFGVLAKIVKRDARTLGTWNNVPARAAGPTSVLTLRYAHAGGHPDKPENGTADQSKYYRQQARAEWLSSLTATECVWRPVWVAASAS
jgi:hypothetical protein